MIVFAVFVSVLRTLRHLGGMGLLLLGFLDSSFLPGFGTLDVVTVILTVRHRELWFYYGLMSTTGSVYGAMVMYRLVRSRGELVLRAKFALRWAGRIQEFVRHWGSMAIFIATIMPPPFPTSAVVMAAAATNYPIKRFFIALILGRSSRFLGLAYLASVIGRRILVRV